MSQIRSPAVTRTGNPAAAQTGGKSGARALTTTPPRHSHPANIAPGLIAHELTHVVQQRRAPTLTLQRQPAKTEVRVESTGSTTIKQLAQGKGGSGAVRYVYSARAQKPPRDRDITKPGSPFDIPLPLLVYPPAILDPPKVDLFVFFHGMRADYGEGEEGRREGSEPIALWSNLKEAVAGTNRIGIAPQAPATWRLHDIWGKDSDNPGKRKLEKTVWQPATAQWHEALANVGFDGLINIALKGLTSDLGLDAATPLVPGTIHVAGHSAGGQGIKEATNLAAGGKTFGDRVQDVTLQDAGYGDRWGPLMDWFLHGSPGKTVRVLISDDEQEDTRSVLSKFNVKSIEKYIADKDESKTFKATSVKVEKPEEQEPRPGGFILESQLVVENTKTGVTQGTLVVFFAPGGGHYETVTASMGAAAAAGPQTAADFFGVAKPGEFQIISKDPVTVFADKDLNKRAKRTPIEGREAKPGGTTVQVTALELGKPKKAAQRFMAKIGDEGWIPLASLAPPTAPMFNPIAPPTVLHKVQPKRIIQRQPVQSGSGGNALQPLTAAEIQQVLVFETVQLTGGGTLLRTEHVQAAMDERASNPELSSAFDNAVRALAAMPFDAQPSAIRLQAAELIKILELQFILDPNASGLDLLPPDRARRYRDFNWQRLDYPGRNEGDPAGPNESRARAMARELSDIRPERRANRTDASVVAEGEFDRRMRRYVVDQLREVPGQEAYQLNRQALESFVRMRDAAEADGVELIIEASYRSPERARANAEGSGNSEAVGAFSSHILGLAIDFRMSHGSQQYQEITTRPMQNVVDMRQSPAHKWLFLRGAAYGWYPLQNEPWHWEYNPPGFREQFRDELNPSGTTGNRPAQN